MLSVLTFILSLFGIPFGRDNMNVDYNRVSSIVFTSTPVKLNMGTSIYHTMQGGCTDGKYAYYILLDTRNDKSYATIAKYDLENWECVFSKSKLALDHGNDMTYNPKIKKLVVVHNAPNRKWISIVNPDSLEIEKTVEIKENVYSISYNQKRNQYIIGVAFTYDYAILDEDFNTVKYFKGVESKSTKQGMDSDDNYVYFILSGPNILAVYDWNGKFITRVSIPVAMEMS